MSNVFTLKKNPDWPVDLFISFLSIVPISTQRLDFGPTITYIRYTETKGCLSIPRLSTSFPVHYSSCFPMYYWHRNLASCEINLILFSKRFTILSLLIIFPSACTQRQGSGVAQIFFLYRISNGRFIYFLCLKNIEFLPGMQPSQPFTVQRHSGKIPSVPRLANQYLCEINMSTRALTSLHYFDSNRAFLSLRSQVPIFSTPNHRGQDSPHREQGAISSYFTNRSINFRIPPGHSRLRYAVFLRVTFEQI